MWGAQGWNQWALQPAMFNDVPHEQIDWAALAKQWIQMQQTQSADSTAPPVIPTVPPPAPASSAVPPPPSIIHPPPPGHSLVPEEFPSEASLSTPLLKTPVVPGGLPEPFQNDRPFESEPAGFIPKPASNTFWNKSQWEASAANDIDERIWPAPPPIESTSSMITGKETYDYGHMHDNPPLAMQSIDYNHMSEFSYNQVYPPESQYDQYWSQVNAAPPISPMFLKKEQATSTTTPTSSTSLPVEEDTSQIDAAKRKQLPAWIREGLEKMEQERIKKLEKEKADKEKAEKLAQAALDKDLALKEASNSLPVKSKFESDSDGDAEEENVNSEQHMIVSERSPSPVEDIRTEEEKRQEFMLTLRRILTDVLLTVTNSEMYAIAEEVIKKEKLKARQLASTASLTSVASGLRGLANYGTESEASEAEEDKDASDSDEELFRRIREKKRLFAIKEKKILADLERREIEEQNEALKARNETVDNEPTEPESFIKDGERANSNEETNLMPFIPPSDVSEHVCTVIPLINEKIIDDPIEAIDTNLSTKEHKKPNNKDSHSSDSSASSSGSESESSEKNKKKSNKSKREGNNSDKSKVYKKDKSPSKKHHRRSSDSDSSDRPRKSRSYDKSSKKSSSYKKKKKYKRSDSSSSSSSSIRRRKYSSSKSELRHNRERRSRSYEDRDRKHRRSVSPRNYRSSRDLHRSRDSYSHRYEKDKYIKRDKEEKYYYDYKRSPSPYRRSSKLPKKYRSSRSLSSESESSGRKMKKSRTR